MGKPLATVTGTALVPGTSRNGRLYTRGNIAKAVVRAQARLAEGAFPLTMLTHHAADTDSTRIIGRITGLRLDEDGSAKFTATVANTDAGRTIHTLIDGDAPFLRGVSIRGAWVGPVQHVQHEGRTVETADDLELDGLDYTASPGVLGARVESVTAGADMGASARETTDGRELIFESVEAVVTETRTETATNEAATNNTNGSNSSGGSGGDGKKPYGDVQYADPGYQADKKKRYPLDTKARAKAAWSYINIADNAKLYTAAQLKRVKGRITAALKKFGVEVNTSEGYLLDRPGRLTEAVQEFYGIPEDPTTPLGSFSVCLTNGPVTVTVNSYCVDPHDLDMVGRAAMDGACQALAAIDPDMDGDIDVAGADTTNAMTGAAAGDDDSRSNASSEAAPTVVAGRVVESATNETSPASAGYGNTAPVGAEPQPNGKDANAMSETNQAVEPNQAATAQQAPAAPQQPQQQVAAQQPAPQAQEQAPQTNEATAAAAGSSVTLSADQFQQLLAAARQPVAAAPVAAESAPAPQAQVQAPAQPQPQQPAAAPVSQGQPQESAPTAGQVVTETEDQRIARLVQEQVTEMMQHQVAAGNGPARKGLVESLAETTANSGKGELNSNGLPSNWPDKPLHEYSDEERRQYMRPTTAHAVLRDRSGY